MNVKTLILAAGSSSRLGKKKQLLTFEGDTLLNRTINLCHQASIGDIHVILGYSADEIQASITNDKVKTIFHPHWEKGMGSSLAKGIQSLPDACTGVFIFLTDQINLSIDIINALKMEAEQFPHAIITSHYGNNFGAPTYFPSSHFPALRKLDGAKGAKKFIKEHIEEVRFVEFIGGQVDIDLPSDLDRIIN